MSKHDSSQNNKSSYDPMDVMVLHDWSRDGKKDVLDYMIQEQMFNNNSQSSGGSSFGPPSSGGNPPGYNRDPVPPNGNGGGKKPFKITKKNLPVIIIWSIVAILCLYFYASHQAKKREEKEREEFIHAYHTIYLSGSSDSGLLDDCAYYLSPEHPFRTLPSQKTFINECKAFGQEGWAWLYYTPSPYVIEEKIDIEIIKHEQAFEAVLERIEATEGVHFLYQEIRHYEYEDQCLRHYKADAQNLSIVASYSLRSVIHIVIMNWEDAGEPAEYKDYETDMRPELYPGYYETEDGKEAKEAMNSPVPTSSPTPRPAASSKKKSQADYYNVNDYDDPEDCYDDHYGDFDTYEDAEDYFEDYHD